MTTDECCRGACAKRLRDGLGARRSERGYNAFTLIELIVVVGVIIILTGLVLSTVGYARKKGARARAETEIAAKPKSPHCLRPAKVTRRIMEFTPPIRIPKLSIRPVRLIRPQIRLTITRGRAFGCTNNSAATRLVTVSQPVKVTWRSSRTCSYPHHRRTPT